MKNKFKRIIKNQMTFKKILLTISLLSLIQTTLFSQIGDPVQAQLPDTLMIQYLSKADGQATDFYAKSFAKELAKDTSMQHQLLYTKSNSNTRFLVKVSGLNRFNALAIVRKSFGDAYYVDDRGWKINY